MSHIMLLDVTVTVSGKTCTEHAIYSAIRVQCSSVEYHIAKLEPSFGECLEGSALSMRKGRYRNWLTCCVLLLVIRKH